VSAWATFNQVVLGQRKADEKSAKGGIHARRLQARWNNGYLPTILKS
jgi:hypothetical protein